MLITIKSDHSKIEVTVQSSSDPDNKLGFTLATDFVPLSVNQILHDIADHLPEIFRHD